MKIIALVSILFLLSSISAQEVFKSENGKYGISRYGDANESILFPAEYKKIISYPENFYVGIKDGLYYLLSSNEDLNNIGYNEIEEIALFEGVVFCYRNGLIDIIRIYDNHLIIKGVKGTKASNDIKDEFGENMYMVTINSQEGLGLVNLELEKQILPTTYKELQIYNDYLIVTTEEDMKGVYHLNGAIVFEPQPIEFSSFETSGPDEKRFTLNGGKKYKSGYYDSEKKYYIPPIYSDIECIDFNCSLVIVYTKKHTGLFFNGEQILECKYEDISGTGEPGYIAEAYHDDKLYFVKPSGELVPESVVYPEIDE